VGAVLGYRSVGPPAASPPVKKPPTEQSQPKASFVKPALSSPKPARSSPKPDSNSATSVPLSMEQGIQAAIERWQNAILSGDPDVIAACYAPRLERYLDRQNSTSALVRQAAMRSFQQYGKPAILRISGLTILPVSPDRAIATFRKHWQTGGPRVFAGEEQERLALVRVGESPEPLWRIISEEQTKVYWSQRPRTRSDGRR